MTIGLPTHSHRFLLLFLLIIVAVSYSNTLYSPLVLDDYNAFVEEPNLYLNDISLQSIAGLAQTRFGLPRVLPLATFALDHYVGKGDILQYHLTNIIIHLLLSPTQKETPAYFPYLGAFGKVFILSILLT